VFFFGRVVAYRVLVRQEPGKGEQINNLVRKLSLVVSFILSVCWSVPCQAAESAFKSVFTDPLYGGLIGTPVGAAFLTFAVKPGDHLDYMAYGAATGIVAGAAYGIGKAMVEMENGRVTWSMPTFIPGIQDTNSKGQTPIVVMAGLLRGKF
jgi:hypothetical protein